MPHHPSPDSQARVKIETPPARCRSGREASALTCPSVPRRSWCPAWSGCSLCQVASLHWPRFSTLGPSDPLTGDRASASGPWPRTPLALWALLFRGALSSSRCRSLGWLGPCPLCPCCEAPGRLSHPPEESPGELPKAGVKQTQPLRH